VGKVSKSSQYEVSRRENGVTSAQNKQKNAGESSYESQTKEMHSCKKIEEHEIKFSKTPNKRNESSSFSKSFLDNSKKLRK
jgi:hypothetical protein